VTETVKKWTYLWRCR